MSGGDHVNSKKEESHGSSQRGARLGRVCSTPQGTRGKDNPTQTGTAGEESAQGADGGASQGRVRRRPPQKRVLPEDRDYWEDELTKHCANIYGDPEEDSGRQGRRIKVFRQWRDTHEAEEGSMIEITADSCCFEPGRTCNRTTSNGPDTIVTGDAEGVACCNELCDHPMAPARVSWRVRFAELMEDCEASVPGEAGGLGRKGYSGVQGSGAHVGDWEGGY